MTQEGSKTANGGGVGVITSPTVPSDPFGKYLIHGLYF